jgi:hypothetical protein
VRRQTGIPGADVLIPLGGTSSPPLRSVSRNAFSALSDLVRSELLVIHRHVHTL